MTENHPVRYPYQRGTVLIIALILLLGMTLLAVPAIDGASLQAQMARNTLEARTLYQISLSEAEYQFQALKNADFRQAIQNAADTVADPVSGEALPEPGVVLRDSQLRPLAMPEQYRRSATITRSGSASRQLSGYSLNGFQVHHYQIIVDTRLPGTAYHSTQVLGVAHVTPSNPAARH